MSGSVWSVDVDGVLVGLVTLVAGGGLCTLGSGVGCCVTVLLSTFALVAKMSANCCNAVVCCVVRVIGAFDTVCMAVMRSCAARRIVSPGSIAGIFVCFGKNFADPKMQYPFVDGMKKR